MMQWNAIILAGGRAARLGGIDKCGIEIGGRRLLDAALAATEGAAARVIVGPERRWARGPGSVPPGRCRRSGR